MDISSVYPGVREIIVDVLAVDAADILPEKRLVADLGAESIDFLDLVFQLERKFDIKIPRGQLEKKARGSLKEEEFEKNGLVTPEGLKVLKANLPEVSEACFTPKLKVNEIPTLFTVETCCRWVLNAQEEQQKGASSTEQAS